MVPLPADSCQACSASACTSFLTTIIFFTIGTHAPVIQFAHFFLAPKTSTSSHQLSAFTAKGCRIRTHWYKGFSAPDAAEYCRFFHYATGAAHGAFYVFVSGLVAVGANLLLYPTFLAAGADCCRSIFVPPPVVVGG